MATKFRLLCVALLYLLAPVLSHRVGIPPLSRSGWNDFYPSWYRNPWQAPIGFGTTFDLMNRFVSPITNWNHRRRTELFPQRPETWTNTWANGDLFNDIPGVQIPVNGNLRSNNPFPLTNGFEDRFVVSSGVGNQIPNANGVLNRFPNTNSVSNQWPITSGVQWTNGLGGFPPTAINNNPVINSGRALVPPTSWSVPPRGTDLALPGVQNNNPQWLRQNRNWKR